MKKYNSLNGLRAIAAIGIVLMHVRANFDVGVAHHFIYTNVIAKMSDFVFLFMMISAFSLCCGYYDKFKNGTITPNKFYKRRYSRILPFFSVLVILSIIIPHSPNKVAVARAPLQFLGDSGFSPYIERVFEGFTELTLSYGLLPNPSMSIMGVGWFLGVIFVFYMLFPFFIFMIDNKRRSWYSFIVVNILCFITISYFYSDKFISFNAIPKNIIYNAPFFVLGGILFLHRELIERIVCKNHLISLSACIIFSAAYFLWADTKMSYSGVVIICLVMGCWLVFAIGSNSKLLHNPTIDYLGNISMEIYLSHMLSFRIVKMLNLSDFIHQVDILYWLSCFMTLLVAIAFSHLVKYYFIAKLQLITKRK